MDRIDIATPRSESAQHVRLGGAQQRRAAPADIQDHIIAGKRHVLAGARSFIAGREGDEISAQTEVARVFAQIAGHSLFLDDPRLNDPMPACVPPLGRFAC